jgi:hypothetical protein
MMEPLRQHRARGGRRGVEALRGEARGHAAQHDGRRHVPP